MNSKAYRWCSVPLCTNTSIKTPEKLFIFVPFNKTVRNKWLELARRDLKGLTPTTQLYFCEDHFDLEKDMENYMQFKIMGSVKQIRMKQQCIPSRFHCEADTKHQSISNEPNLVIAKRERIFPKEDIEENFVLQAKEPDLDSSRFLQPTLGPPEPIAFSSELEPSILTPCEPKPTLVPKSLLKLMPTLPKLKTMSAPISSQVSTSVSTESTTKETKAGIDRSFSCTVCKKFIKGHMFACAECSYRACAKCDALKKHYQHYVLRIPCNKSREEVDAVIENVHHELVSILSESAVNQRKRKSKIKHSPRKTPRRSKTWVDTSLSKTALQKQKEDKSNQNTETCKASRTSTRSQNDIQKEAEKRTFEPENTDVIKQAEILQICQSDEKNTAITIETSHDGNNKRTQLTKEEIFDLDVIKVEIDDPLEYCEQYPDAPWHL